MDAVVNEQVAQQSSDLTDCEGGSRACTGVNVKLVEDPYQAEVRGEQAMVWLCEACWSERKADV